MRTGLSEDANGSCYMETGLCKVACAVYGPRQVGNAAYSATARLNCEVRFASFGTSQHLESTGDAIERDLGQMVSNALEPAIFLDKFPKSSIDIFVTVLESDNNTATLAAIMTAASTAIADASIDSCDVVTGSSLVYKDGKVILDPDKSQLMGCKCSLVVGYMAARQELSETFLTGPARLGADAKLLGLETLLSKAIDHATDIRWVTNRAIKAGLDRKISSQ